MNGAKKIVNAMKKVNDSNKSIPSKIVSATVISVNPLLFRLENRLEIDSSFYELSDLEDWDNIKVGTTVRAFTFNEGQKYYILETSTSAKDILNHRLLPDSVIGWDGDEIPEGWEEFDLEISEGGTNDYNLLQNKPTIEGIELKGDKTFENLGIKALTNLELEELLNSQI